MTDLFAQPDDATPLDAEECEGLLQTWITTRADLNEAEQANIDAAVAWTVRRRDTEILTEGFVFELHKRMFGDVWSWAGTTRKTGKNIGVDPRQIHLRLGGLLRDARYWIEQKAFAPDEIAARLHHGLVAIHPFPNGNGRHARLFADLQIEELGQPAFTWGGGTLRDIGTLRAEYIAALRAADSHDMAPLLAFARN
ncbi:mobile mystery protein B [Sphingomonas sp. TX0543]|uniref:Cell filamentation protein Fic n=1 Tax=Edaphosphingomonas fennica TaxID=114404 RepID=A0A2T4I511_9SPHN|nr:mobile mystery protein B [Sphingomonas fennica]PTD24805.1 cell filamentation protein Fic [Sphingomonas fennica]